MLLCREINNVLGGENVREKLKEFMDSSLGDEYPLELAFTMAQLAKSCVAPDINSRPSIAQVLTTLLMIVSSSIDWEPSHDLLHDSGSFGN
ncbi:BnaC04g43970D [Brassica napus]|uniref:BnaC04g43970D protein n=4 Tax=Brassica TaxID=3705 RepID=A0A078GB94_BRANA|nr:BnaC04g43970D [Brassica napus]